MNEGLLPTDSFKPVYGCYVSENSYSLLPAPMTAPDQFSPF